MAKPKHSRTKRLVLDIGSSAIRLCELAQTKTGFQLTKYYQREFLAEPSMGEEEKKSLQCAALAQVLKDAKVRTRKTVFGVPGQSVFVRNRALPPVPEHKVTQIVRYEIQQQIPFGLDQIALDYQVLNRTEAGGYDVLMAAIKVDVVDKRIDIIRSSKCRVDVVDVCPMAAYNWLKHTGEFGEQGECVALIDLGASTTDIVIERENQFRFTRSLNLGGNDVTLAISNNFGMSFADAEKLKRERGFAPTGDPKVDGRGGEVIGQILTRLVTEINRSFAYFRSQPGGGSVTRAIVTGGGACLRNVIPYLQRQLGVEVRIAQPLSGLAIAPSAQEASERPEQACVALGLALRCNTSVPIAINLIPPRILESARRREQIVYWALSFVALALICATIIPDYEQKNQLVLKQTEMVKRALQSYDPELATVGTSVWEQKLTNAQDRIRQYRDRVAALDNARKNRLNLLPRLWAVNEARPEGKGLWFASVETILLGEQQGPPGMGGYRKGSVAGNFVAGMGGSLNGPLGSTPTKRIPFSEFPGLGPERTPGSLGGLGRIGGARRLHGGGGSGPGYNPNEPPPPPPKVNGICIRGYAVNPETITEFIAHLRQIKAPVFSVDNGKGDAVYWDDSSMARRSVSVLDDAATVETFANSAMGTTSGSSNRLNRLRRHSGILGGGTGNSFSMMNGFGAPGGSGASSVVPDTVPNVTSFTVELQFGGGPRVKPVVSTAGGFGSHRNHRHVFQ